MGLPSWHPPRHLSLPTTHQRNHIPQFIDVGEGPADKTIRPVVYQSSHSSARRRYMVQEVSCPLSWISKSDKLHAPGVLRAAHFAWFSWVLWHDLVFLRLTEWCGAFASFHVSCSSRTFPYLCSNAIWVLFCFPSNVYALPRKHARQIPATVSQSLTLSVYACVYVFVCMCMHISMHVRGWLYTVRVLRGKVSQERVSRVETFLLTKWEMSKKVRKQLDVQYLYSLRSKLISQTLLFTHRIVGTDFHFVIFFFLQLSRWCDVLSLRFQTG